MTCKVLVVDDDRAVREALAQTIEMHELEALVAGSFVAAKDHLTKGFDGVVLSDIRMPGRDGFHLLDYAQGADPDLPVILLTGEGDVPMAVDAMSRGAFDFLEKPCAPARLMPVVRRALAARALVLENRRLKKRLETGDPAARLLLGISERADELRQHVRRAARAGTEVLVTGPPGSGVSKVAEVLHLMSERAAGPFVKRPAAALSPADLRKIRAEAAGGSLFLDEVQGLSAETQFDLLESFEADRMGAGRVRIIAGSTRDLAQASRAGEFNADLYYRLAIMNVRIPALAERPEDIPVLFRHYVALAAEQAGLRAPDVSAAYAAALLARDWPGNTRALMSEAMRFVLGLPEEAPDTAASGLAAQMARVERSLLISALQRHHGNATETARELHLPRKTFYDKLARHGIRPEAFRR